MGGKVTRVGLRVDVDTLRGTMLGVPSLVKAFERHAVKATFFFSVGPDNMGRNIYRLLRPTFFIKMMRSGAPSLYGWDILLKGTAWPGPVIGRRAGNAIKAAAESGHEIGLHAWDHYLWQNHIQRMKPGRFEEQFACAYEMLSEIAGKEPVASANPAWRSTETSLRTKDRYPFRYNSDCRGARMFVPLIGDEPARAPQIPVTLPTYDEIVGRGGITDDNYNDTILDRIDPEGFNVYTLHAEVEGVARREMFDDFLKACRERGLELATLGELVAAVGSASLPISRMVEKPIPGRDGNVAMEEPA